MTITEQPCSVPGPNCEALLVRRMNAVAKGVANGAPIFAASASGAIITDMDGREFIDFAGGIGTLNVGHAHPTVVNAVRAQAEQLPSPNQNCIDSRAGCQTDQNSRRLSG